MEGPERGRPNDPPLTGNTPTPMSSSTGTRRLSDQRGAAAVEFALVAALLLTIVFGIFEFGRIYSELEVLASAAREGARAAAVRGTAEEIKAATEAAASPYELDSTPVADKVCDDSTSGDPVTVAWTQNIKISVGLLPPLNKDFEIKGVFRCE
jgi:Flp pilus assembly protein TadG